MSKTLYRLIKRLFDLLVSLIGLIVLSPLLLLLALLVRVNLGSPVLFCQPRPGYKGKIFNLYKFRSMKDGTGSDEERLTKFGRILRASSLDELPELLNVLKGEMSLVGPRPLLVQYLERYNAEQARRHDVRPGITGWAQVHGRNAISWEEKFRLDVWYVDHQSLWLDLKILFMTVRKVFVHEGITAAGSATAGEFMGNDTDAAERP